MCGIPVGREARQGILCEKKVSLELDEGGIKGGWLPLDQFFRLQLGFVADRGAGRGKTWDAFMTVSRVAEAGIYLNFFFRSFSNFSVNLERNAASSIAYTL